MARLADSVPRDVVDDIFGCALKKQTGVSLKYMLDFGANPIERQLILSAQFLHNELPVSSGASVCLVVCSWAWQGPSVVLAYSPLTCFMNFQGIAQCLVFLLHWVSVSSNMALGQVRLAHRVAELENLPYGLSAKAPVLKVTAPDFSFLVSVAACFHRQLGHCATRYGRCCCVKCKCSQLVLPCQTPLHRTFIQGALYVRKVWCATKPSPLPCRCGIGMSTPSRSYVAFLR